MRIFRVTLQCYRQSYIENVLSKKNIEPDIIFKGSSHPELFSGKGVLKICSEFIGEHQCRSVISIKLK